MSNSISRPFSLIGFSLFYLLTIPACLHAMEAVRSNVDTTTLDPECDRNLFDIVEQILTDELSMGEMVSPRTQKFVNIRLLAKLADYLSDPNVANEEKLQTCEEIQRIQNEIKNQRAADRPNEDLLTADQQFLWNFEDCFNNPTTIQALTKFLNINEFEAIAIIARIQSDIYLIPLQTRTFEMFMQKVSSHILRNKDELSDFINSIIELGPITNAKI